MRTRAWAIALVGLQLLVACASTPIADSEPSESPATVSPSNTTATRATSPTASTFPPGPIEYNISADNVVFRYVTFAGAQPEDDAFKSIPRLLIFGDGRVVIEAPLTGDRKRRLVREAWTQQLTVEGVQRFLATARDVGLMAETDYSMTELYTDNEQAEIEVRTAGGSWTTDVNALFQPEAIDEVTAEAQANREALASFLAAREDLTSVVGADNVTASMAFRADWYNVRVFLVTNNNDGQPVLAWPDDSPTDLSATADACIPASEIGELFENARSDTLFEQDEKFYWLFVRQSLSADGCDNQ